MDEVFVRANQELERIGIGIERNGVAIMFRYYFSQFFSPLCELPPSEQDYQHALVYAEQETFHWIQARLNKQALYFVKP